MNFTQNAPWIMHENKNACAIFLSCAIVLNALFEAYCNQSGLNHVSLATSILKPSINATCRLTILWIMHCCLWMTLVISCYERPENYAVKVNSTMSSSERDPMAPKPNWIQWHPGQVGKINQCLKAYRASKASGLQAWGTPQNNTRS